MRVHPSESGQKAEIVGALLRRGTEEEVAAGQLVDPAPVIVAVRIEPQSLEMGQVLDEEGIVEIDHSGQIGQLVEHVVRQLSLGDGRVAVPQQLRQRRGVEPARLDGTGRHVRGLARAPGRNQGDLESEVRQPPSHLQVANADAGRALPERLAADQTDPGHRRSPAVAPHPEPRRDCRVSCSRQARVAFIFSISAMRSRSRS